MVEIQRIDLPDWAEGPDAYRQALIDLVGDHDPLDVIAQTPVRVRELIHGQGAASLARRPAGGEWSAAEILGHLLDDEIVNGFRLRMTLTSSEASYPGTDPESWVRLPKPPLDQVLAAWEGLRVCNLFLMRSIPRAEWQRSGNHAEQGSESVEVQLLKNAGHDLAHLNQLARCLAR